MAVATEVALIRKAEHRDTEQVLALINEFYYESLREYDLSFTVETLKETIANFIDNHVGLVAEREGKIVGVIGGLISRSIFNKDEVVGQEAIWYMSKDERKGSLGIRLMKAFERTCKEKGAKFIVMIHMSNLLAKSLGRFYSSMKYKLMEVQFIKEV